MRLRALIYKEFIVMLMDSGTRKILVLPIILQSLLFGYGATFNLEHVPYILYQQNFDATANEIVQQIDNNDSFEMVRFCTDELCFRQGLDHGDALIGVYIDSNFTKSRSISIVADARNTASANSAAGYIQSIISKYNETSSTKVLSSTIDINTRYLFNVNNITRYGMMTGMILALSMIQVLLLSSLSVSREREEGTFDMMLMAPLTPVEILIGKSIPPTLIAISQGLGLYLICELWFKIHLQGSFIALLATISIFSLCTVGIGLVVSALASTSQQSVVSAFTIVLPTIIVSGMVTPRSAMPELMQYISLINPFYYGLEAVHRIYLEGQSFWEVAHLMLPLIGLGAITMSAAVYLFRGKLG